MAHVMRKKFIKKRRFPSPLYSSVESQKTQGTWYCSAQTRKWQTNQGYTKCVSCYRTTYTPKYSHFNMTNSHKNSTNSRYLNFVFCNLAAFKKKGISKFCASWNTNVNRTTH